MYVFAVQEMNVPMSQVHWMTRNVASSGAAGALNPTGFPSPRYTRIPIANQGGATHAGSAGAYKHKKPINRLFPFYRPIWFDLNFSLPATNKFTATWMWNQPDVCRPKTVWQAAGSWWELKRAHTFNQLVSCKIWGGTKKIYICYVLYMVCIVFVKMKTKKENRPVFFRTMLLFEDVWKMKKIRGRIPRRKKIRLYSIRKKVFAYSTALRWQCF